MPEGLREGHCAIREFLSMLPQMVNHTVRPCRNFCYLGSLVGRHIQDLDAARGDLDFMIVEMAVPLDRGQLSRKILRDEILNRNKFGFGISGIE